MLFRSWSIAVENGMVEVCRAVGMFEEDSEGVFRAGAWLSAASTLDAEGCVDLKDFFTEKLDRHGAFPDGTVLFCVHVDAGLFVEKVF